MDFCAIQAIVDSIFYLQKKLSDLITNPNCIIIRGTGIFDIAIQSSQNDYNSIRYRNSKVDASFFSL